MFIDLVDIKKGDLISIVGSGGKTSLMYYISSNFLNSKILITTTTKIFVPNALEYDKIFVGKDDTKYIEANIENGRYIFARKVEGNKIIGFDKNIISQYIKFFDLILVESDGSKMKLLKGWKENEPVILKETTKTIGVINLKLLGHYANENLVHNFSHFSEIADCKCNAKIEYHHIKNTIFHRDGLFKGFSGEKILFINQIDNLDEEKSVKKFLETFSKEEKQTFKKIIYGSLESNYFNKCQLEG